MTTLREAAQQALEALEAGDWYINQLELIVYSVDDTGTDEERAKVQVAITALRAALAQPVQEPCPNCASLEAQNTELDAILARLADTERPATLTKPCGSLGEDVSLCRYPDCAGGQAGTICNKWCPACPR